MQPINTALLSYGMSGQVFHAPFLHVLPAFHFYSVWERSKKLAHIKYPDVRSVYTIEEIINDPQVELVVVNTPNYTHYEYAKSALLAGKHVIVEKPFTVTTEEAKELIKLAKNNHNLLSVYHNRRYDSDYRTIKKVLDQKLLGDIIEAEFHYDRYKTELSPKVHKELPGKGTGALYDLGSHLIDQALQLFGKPEAVFADIQIVRPASQVDDYFELLLYYPRMRVRLRCSYLVREVLPGYILHGSKGSFIKSKTDVQETDLQAGRLPGAKEWGSEPDSEKGFLHTEKEGLIIREHIPSERGNYGDYYNQVYESIRENKQAPVPAEDGLAVVHLIQKAFLSNGEKRVVEC